MQKTFFASKGTNYLVKFPNCERKYRIPGTFFTDKEDKKAEKRNKSNHFSGLKK